MLEHRAAVAVAAATAMAVAHPAAFKSHPPRAPPKVVTHPPTPARVVGRGGGGGGRPDAVDEDGVLLALGSPASTLSDASSVSPVTRVCSQGGTLN